MQKIKVEVKSDSKGTYHINASISGVESQQVVSDEISLLVEPLGLENEPIL